MDCAAINVTRLRREMSERAPDDPWSLDLNRICLRLAAEEFRLTDIRPAPCRDLLLELSPGWWFLESPFCEPVSAQMDGSLRFEAVPLGAHFLMAEDPAGDIFFLYVEEERELLLRR
jgi:hypothetical protein